MEDTMYLIRKQLLAKSNETQREQRNEGKQNPQIFFPQKTELGNFSDPKIRDCSRRDPHFLTYCTLAVLVI